MSLAEKEDKPLESKYKKKLIDPSDFIAAKFEETKLVGVKSTLKLMSNVSLTTNAYNIYNQANENNDTIKDYLFPEIRAAQDRSKNYKSNASYPSL